MAKKPEILQKGVVGILVIVIVVALAGVAFVAWKSLSSTKGSSSGGSGTETWTETGAAIAGNFADADVVDLENGKFRMYYSAEPETPNFQGQVYSATSGDGIKWAKEDGTRITSAIFPSVIKLPDGRYRMYFQDQQLIKSAISSDGLTWEKEAGTRIDATNPSELTLSSVVAPTVIKSGNEYLMVYGGVINQTYTKEKVPSRDTHLLLWATSKDGLTFDKKGIALDSRNDVFKGWQDGPELMQWDDGSIRLYLWGYFGVYMSTFEKGGFSEPKFVFYGPNFDEKALFPPSPPGDPTLAKIAGTWNMYYGYHTKGIYRAVLR
ncbi:hypothetical protein A2630_04815 [Candidatus Woesebacteria bacterium RIFCSPHIGHO2_01_FULL_44_10]|uniref:Glycosyl hydrolase family 32 N-terminal domain-containing protein n=1 Tax=Candidatus Woesebacteria bacterium RIFCSPLOWO2_01_FULL_44_14 TaxID=1802525 RepID=A0A1F8BZZ5_9BACT|nr:MAG: hypothetical protein A2630_04815 [Candidatus Woesebacteria bacterium RIFCSPHIGHO2_01_FULL_44_10]OGM54752.1 MAG: hypothetical protein A3F62_01630 [Candidatus Woesebacteria bacterium RIFCSPHIGHO2_12_FULL_44_11]OGM69656.1 MAG: hypothetical protein A2975_00915 [Candidatus Woesebacteria bacterium RIFCSPLOWO2_01_FULL_44_14]